MDQWPGAGSHPAPQPASELAAEAPVSRLRIGFRLLDQFTLAAFSGLIDVLRLAADMAAAAGSSTRAGR